MRAAGRPAAAGARRVPRRGRGRRRRLRRPPARRVHLRSAADLGRRSVLGSLRRRRPASTSSCRCRGSRSWRGARASRARAAIPERELNGPVRGWQEIYREGIAALGDDFSTSTREQDRGSTQPELRSCCSSTRAKARTARPSTAATATSPGWRAIGSPATCNRAAAPTTRSPACLTFDVGRSSAPGPAGATAADVLTARGLVGVHAREGPQPPARARAAVRRARPRLERRDQVRPSPLPRPRSVARAAHATGDGGRRRPPLRRRRQQPAVDRRRRRLPRRRQAPALPRGRLPAACRSSARSRAPTSSTGRSTTTRWSRTTPRPSGSSAWPATTPRNPFAAWRSGPVPDAARAPTCSARCSPAAAAERLGYHPYRAPTGVELRAVRRPARVQQLRVLRASTAARSTPRATRSRRCAARCAPAAARSGPRASSIEVLLDAPGERRRGVRYLDADGDAHEVTAATWSSSPAARSRRRGCCCAASIGNSSGLVGRYLMYHFQTYRARLVPVPAARVQRAATVTHLHDDPIVGDADERGGAREARAAVLPRRHRRARRRRPPDHGGDLPPARARAQRGSMLDSPTARPHGAFTMQGEDLPQATNRIDLDPACATCGASRPGGSRTTPHAHEVACARPLGAEARARS